MTKTLKQILGEKPILFTSDVPERVIEWLKDKRDEHPSIHKFVVINELLEELQK